MRQMSFMLTTPQARARTKTVTRRLGWADLKPGTLIQQVEKGQGLGKGGKVRKIHVIEIVSVRSEPLNAITQADVIAEGFPDMTPGEFVAMFCDHNRPCRPDWRVTRIEFRYVD
jgi:hypothetical protein